MASNLPVLIPELMASCLEAISDSRRQRLILLSSKASDISPERSL